MNIDERMCYTVLERMAILPVGKHMNKYLLTLLTRPLFIDMDAVAEISRLLSLYILS